MRVRAITSLVNDNKGNFHSYHEEFDVDDERGEFLLSIDAVERVDKPEQPAKRGPGRPRKTDS